MEQERDDYRDLDRPQRRSVDWRSVRRRLRPVFVPLLVLCIPLTCVFGFCAVRLGKTSGCHRSKFERDRAVLAPVLAADPAFSKVKIQSNSGGGVELDGEVATRADGDRLRAAFVRLFGETQLWRLTIMVRETGELLPINSDAGYTR